MKRALTLILFLSFGILAFSQGKTRVVGYLPTWRSFDSYTENLDFTKFSHINISFANPNAQGILDEGLSDQSLNNFITKAHDNGVQVLISLGGATAPEIWKELVKEDERAAFITDMMSYLETYNFDGVDMDLEGGTITSDYGPFVVDLSEKLVEKDLLLTAAVARWNGNSIPDEALAVFDFLNLMAYDATGPWAPDNAGQHSSMSFAQQNLDYWVNTRDYPASDCVLGVPFYGYDFDRNGAYVTFNTIVSQNPTAANKDVVGNIYYNGKPTISEKTKLAIEGYGGIMIWELTQDATDENSLLDTIIGTIEENNYVVDVLNRRPRSIITSPNEGDIILENGTVNIIADAQDFDGSVAYSALIFNGDTIERYTNEGPYEVQRSNLSIGEYTVQLFTTDDEGASKTSALVTFFVEKPKPQIALLVPIDYSSTNVDEELEIKVNITDTVANIVFSAIIIDGDTLEKYTTGGAITELYTPTVTGFTEFSIYSINDLGGENTASISVSINEDRQPYNKDPFIVPGIIEAEQYDIGGLNLTYYDNELENQGGSTYRNDATDIENFASGKYNLGYLDVGEWFEYTINVSKDGQYDIFTNNASLVTGGRFELYLDGDLLATSTRLSSTGGWASFRETKVAQNITLNEGEYILRLKITSVAFNLDYLKIEPHVEVGIASFDNSNLGAIFPNPSSEKITVDLLENESASLVIYNLSGVEVASFSLSNSGKQIDINQLDAGTYFCHLIQNQQQQVIKLVKE